jgi:hypothetical protein
MFEHLDDPEPLTSTADVRAEVERRRGRLVRRRRLARGGVSAAVVLALVGGVTIVVHGHDDGRQSVRMVDRPTVTTSPALTVPEPLVCGTLQPEGATRGPVSWVVSDGDFRAELTGDLSDAVPPASFVAGARLLVTYRGHTVLDGGIVPPDLPGAAFLDGARQDFVRPSSLSGYVDAPSRQPICLAKFPTEPAPFLLVGLYSNYAHCCFAVRAYPLTSPVASTPVDLVTGNAPVDVRLVDGSPVVVTADNRFAYEFASFAGSGLPIQIYTVEAGTFREVAERTAYRSLLEADAAKWWGAWTKRQDGDGGLGVLAAWVADEARLGSGPFQEAYATLDRLNAQGQLAGSGQFTGDQYVKALKAFLQDKGYGP